MHSDIVLYRVAAGVVSQATPTADLYFTVVTPDGAVALHSLLGVITAEIDRVRTAAIAAYNQQNAEEPKDELALLLVDDPQPKTN